MTCKIDPPPKKCSWGRRCAFLRFQGSSTEQWLYTPQAFVPGQKSEAVEPITCTIQNRRATSLESKCSGLSCRLKRFWCYRTSAGWDDIFEVISCASLLASQDILLKGKKHSRICCNSATRLIQDGRPEITRNNLEAIRGVFGCFEKHFSEPENRSRKSTRKVFGCFEKRTPGNC